MVIAVLDVSFQSHNGGVVQSAVDGQFSLQGCPAVVVRLFVYDFHGEESFGTHGLRSKDVGGASTTQLAQDDHVLRGMGRTESEREHSSGPCMQLKLYFTN